jgi:pSer/pThr/pTyr-binding forkhead associated (FHA) protein
MATIIIEEINRLGHVTQRHKFDHLPIAIGRGYQNDLILDDPHVSPQHFVIHDDENGWRAEDCNSDNGIKIKSNSDVVSDGLLHSGDDIILGRSRLRVLSPHHPVAATHLLPTRATIAKIISQPGIAITTIIVAIAIVLLDTHLTTTRETGFEKLLANALPTFIFALAWAGIWAFVGRVIIHRAAFVPHFIAAVLVFIASLLSANGGEYLTFNLNNELPATIVELIVIGFALAFMFYINLTSSTNLDKRTSLITGHAVAWSMLLVGLFMQYVNRPEFVASPDYPTQLKPPYVKVSGSKTVDEFLKDSEPLFITDDDEKTP